MRSIRTLVYVLMALSSCAHSDKAAVPGEPVRGTIKAADPAFFEEDVVSQNECKGDSDCPTGSLCYPGMRRCVSSYPNPRMLDLTLGGEGTAQRPCRPVNVYFAFDSTELVDEARRWLEYDVRCIQSRGIRSLTIEGYSDSRGDADYNIDLSVRRGEVVKAYLLSHGLNIPVQVVGRGESNPLRKGGSERDYAWNRRASLRF